MTADEDPDSVNRVGGEAASVHVDLPSDLRAAGQARRATRDVLMRWRLAHLVDAVTLAVSELVTNAVRYGRPPVSIELQRQAEQVRLDVHDGDPAEPPGAPGDAAADAESGRGLAIVQALADEVVVEQVASDGKVIRASFGAEPPADGWN